MLSSVIVIHQKKQKQENIIAYKKRNSLTIKKQNKEDTNKKTVQCATVMETLHTWLPELFQIFSVN